MNFFVPSGKSYMFIFFAKKLKKNINNEFKKISKRYSIVIKLFIQYSFKVY